MGLNGRASTISARSQPRRRPAPRHEKGTPVDAGLWPSHQRGFVQARGILACILAVSAALVAPGCGSPANNCEALLNSYAVEFAAAQVCDPSLAGQCEVQRPVVVSLADGQTVTREGLASNCTHAVNGDRTARLDAVLQEYISNGCKSSPVPVCQSGEGCQPSVNGGYSCAP